MKEAETYRHCTIYTYTSGDKFGWCAIDPQWVDLQSTSEYGSEQDAIAEAKTQIDRYLGPGLETPQPDSKARNAIGFGDIRALNVARVPKFGHSLNEWNILEWLGALCGEAGEAANIAKKIRRIDGGCSVNTGESSRSDMVKKLGGELADIFIYLDLAAASEGIDLEAAIVQKFDEVSERVGFTPFLRVAQLTRMNSYFDGRLKDSVEQAATMNKITDAENAINACLEAFTAPEHESGDATNTAKFMLEHYKERWL